MGSEDKSKNKKEEGKTVEVPESTLQELLSKVEEYEKKDKQREEQIEMLTHAADKGRLAAWDEKHKGGDLIRTAKVSLWEGKIVVGWKMIKDEVFVDKDKVLRENQLLRLYLHTGEGDKPEKQDINYVNFYRNKKMRVGDIVKKSEGVDGNTFTLQFSDGKKIEIDTRFVN